MHSIPFNKYINILSSQLSSNVVPAKELIARFITTNLLLPSQSFLYFTGGPQVALASVGDYFGTSSSEYGYAQFQLSFLNKNGTATQSISFARWVNTAEAPMIFGYKTLGLTDFLLISDGSFNLTLGSTTNLVSALDFTGDASFADIAATLQTAIQSFIGDGTQWTSATVTYDNTTGGFNFVGGNSALADLVSVAEGTLGTDISVDMGWSPQSVNAGPGAIWSNGSAVETITDTLIGSDSNSNNYGSIYFIPELTLDQHIEAETWVQSMNNTYMYCAPTTLTNYSAWSTAMAPYSGTGLSLINSALEVDYTATFPMAIMSSTNYNAPNSTQNYMFQTNNLLGNYVTTLSLSNSLDAASVNYVGLTQQATFFGFYQKGYLMGVGGTSPTFMNTYANECWLKTTMGAALMTLLLTVPGLSANPNGLTQVNDVIQSVVNQALFNGTISVGKQYTQVEITQITNLTNDPNAYLQVQNQGYWYQSTIVPVTNIISGRTEYQINYTLIYGKDDVINKINGNHYLA